VILQIAPSNTSTFIIVVYRVPVSRPIDYACIT